LTCQGDGNLIEWATSTESDNDYFEVLRASSDGIFEIIATIDAAGNSSTEQTYRFLDNSSSERSYYTLYQVDNNGSRTLLGTKSIDCQSDDIIVYPNPFESTLIIELGDFVRNSTGKLDVFDALGKLVMSKEISPNSTEIELNSGKLTSGVYMIRLVSNNKVHTARVIKK
jgi:hypothetical protein